MNLTRFPLRFPEKREFFLQGINAYNFSGDGNAFFSRRIGLNDGTVQPIDVGSKLNGQLGAFEVAVLHARTARLDRSVAEDGTGGPLPGEDFIALRTRRLFFSQSHLGVLYTRRSERGTDADPLHMMGVDLRLATANLLGRGLNFRNRTHYLWATGMQDGRSDRFGSVFDFPNDVWNFRAGFNQIGPAYDPAVGFVFWTNIREYAGSRVLEPAAGLGPVDPAAQLRDHPHLHHRSL